MTLSEEEVLLRFEKSTNDIDENKCDDAETNNTKQWAKSHGHRPMAASPSSQATCHSAL